MQNRATPACLLHSNLLSINMKFSSSIGKVFHSCMQETEGEELDNAA